MNLRTGEVIHMRLHDNICAGSVLDAALDIHFDKETSVDDILARFRCGSKRQSEHSRGQRRLRPKPPAAADRV